MSSVDAQYGCHIGDDDDTLIHMQLSNIAGVSVGHAVLDEDATIGQLRARLHKTPQWYMQYKQFVIATTTFCFDDEYMRFTQTKVVKEHIECDGTGRRTLHATVVGYPAGV